MNILEEIIAHKKKEVENLKEKLSLSDLKKKIKNKEIKKRYFYNAIKEKVSKKRIGLIAEIKKASPSKGIIKKDFNPIEIAKAYKKGGASCLSVLTDTKYFQGNIEYIPEIKQVIDLPILRKDFIIDSYQIFESIFYNSDCILLIVAALEKDNFKKLYEVSLENEVDVLIEVHDEKEMEIALDVIESGHDQILLGINNRNLKTFEISLNTTKNLVKKYKRDLENKIIVSESGIFTSDDIKSLTESGVYSFLVGEGLIKNNDIEKATKVLLG